MTNTNTQHTVGPWKYSKGLINTYVRDITGKDNYRLIADVDFDNGQTLAERDYIGNLIVRLTNLFFAGKSRAEKHSADVVFQGNLPTDPDYGLSENEVAAARMLNTSMDEITALQSLNAELVEALDKAHDALSELNEVADLRGDNDLPHPADDPLMWTARMQEAWGYAEEMEGELETLITKAIGDNSPQPTPPTDDGKAAVAAMEAR